MPHGTIFLFRQKYGKEATKETQLNMLFLFGNSSLKRKAQPKKKNWRKR
jgi:hypothetical protein